MPKRVIKKIHHLTIPYHGNEHKPHVLRRPALHTYSLALLLVKVSLLVVLFGFYPSIAKFSTITSERLLELVNKARVEQNLEPLKANLTLAEAARAKAQDMLKNNYFAHTSPFGVTPWEWFKKVDYEYTYAGENLALNFIEAEDAFEAWMNSPLHQENILSPNYKDMGVAVVVGEIEGEESTLVVQLFGTTYVPVKEKRGFLTATVPPRQVAVAPASTLREAPSPEITGGLVEVKLKEAKHKSFLSKLIFYSRKFFLVLGLFILINLLITIFVRIRIQHKPVIIHTITVLIIALLMLIWKLHFIEGISRQLLIQ